MIAIPCILISVESTYAQVTRPPYFTPKLVSRPIQRVSPRARHLEEKQIAIVLDLESERVRTGGLRGHCATYCHC